MTTEIHEPGPWSDAVEAACDLDRAYFSEHPGAEWYVRKRQPCEHGPADAQIADVFTHTLVREFGPGIRCRQPITSTEAFELCEIRASGMGVIFPENDVTRRMRGVARRVKNQPNE